MTASYRVTKYGPPASGADADLPIETKEFKKAGSAHRWAARQAKSPFYTVVYEPRKAVAYVA